MPVYLPCKYCGVIVERHSVRRNNIATCSICYRLRRINYIRGKSGQVSITAEKMPAQSYVPPAYIRSLDYLTHEKLQALIRSLGLQEYVDRCRNNTIMKLRMYDKVQVTSSFQIIRLQHPSKVR